MTEIKRIGILTGGGDAPGINAVLEGLVTRCTEFGWECFGFTEGWAGVIRKEFNVLDLSNVRGIRAKGGTMLFSSRTPVFPKKEGQPDNSTKVIQNLKELEIDALFAIGGEDTQGEGWRLYHEHGLSVIGIPKTIDRDVNGTDYTFGFDTATNITTTALRNLRTTARSHHRVLVVEIMGRYAGWITLEAGIAGNAHGIWTPEMNEQGDIFAIIKKMILRRYKQGPEKSYAILAVSEGAADQALIDNTERIFTQAQELLTQGGMNPKDIQQVIPKGLFDDFGHINLPKLGIAELLCRRIETEMGEELSKILGVKFECRPVVLSHLQRSGPPSAFDANLGVRFGMHAAELAKLGHFGMMAALSGSNMTQVSLQEAMSKARLVPEQRWQQAIDLMKAA